MSSPNQIPYRWSPRSYQLPVFEAMAGGCKRFLLVWPRRSGKSQLALQVALWSLWSNPGSLIWLVGPYQKQARSIFWTEQFLFQHLPPEIVRSTNEARLEVELVNDSRLVILGADNADKLVGTKLNGVVFTEFALANPSAYNLVLPSVQEAKGFILIDSTPRGYINHLYQFYQRAIARPETWFVSWEKGPLFKDAKGENGSPIFTQRDIDDAIADGLDPALVDQEYFAAFDGYSAGTFYGKAMQTMQNDGNLTVVPWNPDFPCFAVCDTGVSDDTSILIAQLEGNAGGVRIIDQVQDNGRSLSSYVSEIQKKPYNIRNWYFPHDFRQREFTSGVSRESTARSLGLDVSIVDNVGIMDGIDKARNLLLSGGCKIDHARCEKLIESLTAYSRRWNDKLKAYENSPMHNQFSHAADAFRYLALALPKERERQNMRPYPGHYNCEEDVFATDAELRREWDENQDARFGRNRWGTEYPVYDERGKYRTTPDEDKD